MGIRLKSKLTGITGELRYCAGKEEPIEVVIKESGNVFIYKTLGALLNDWAEFTVRTPLIEDEKIRKAVRAWAEVNGVKKVTVEKDFSTYAFYPTDTDRVSISVWTEPSLSNLSKDKTYTIAELCGKGKA